MPDYLATVTLPTVSGLAADDVQLDFVIASSVTVAPGDTLDLSGPIANFFNTHDGAGHWVAEFLGQQVKRDTNGAIIRYYDISAHLDGSNHGSPVAVDHFTVGPISSNSSSLPDEVAVVMTLRGEGWDTASVEVINPTPSPHLVRPKQRHSGRLYVGPINLAGYGNADNRPRPATVLRTTLLNAAERLQDELSAVPATWCVWSRKDAVLRDVVRAEVDDAWDTQRRRGVKPLTRDSRVLIP